MAPEVTSTPDAPAAAREALAALGPLTRDERIVMITFLVMVALWASASTLGIDSTAVAFLGLGVFLATGVLTAADIAKEGDVLATYLWFALLFAMSSQLNELGFMCLCRRAPGAARCRAGRGWSRRPGARRSPTSCCTSSSSARRRTCSRSSACSWTSASRLGVPAMPLALLLLFATNFFSAITPQASSANLLFAGSGYLSQRDLYRLGAITTIVNLIIYLVIGTPWFFLVMR